MGLGLSRSRRNQRSIPVGWRPVGCQGLLCPLAVGGGPAQLAAAVARGLIELTTQPVPLSRISAVDTRWRSGLLRDGATTESPAWLALLAVPVGGANLPTGA